MQLGHIRDFEVWHEFCYEFGLLTMQLSIVAYFLVQFCQSIQYCKKVRHEQGNKESAQICFFQALSDCCDMHSKHAGIFSFAQIFFLCALLMCDVVCPAHV